MTRARLEEIYKSDIRPKLQKELDLKNIMEVPELSKIVINVGVKDAVADSKVLNTVTKAIELIAGQKSVKTLSKKSIASFKLRKGMPIGVRVTLRKKRMYEFLDRLINLALPKTRDFQGVSTTAFDERGNYNLGLKEWIVFPEINYEVTDKVYGLNVTICTRMGTKDSELAGKYSRELLKQFGMPFRRA